MIRLSKESALRFAKKWTPLYADVFRSLQQEGGRVQIESRFASVRQHLGTYVQLYDDEKKLGVAFLLALLGEDRFKEINETSESWTEQERAEFLESFSGEESEEDIGGILSLSQSDEDLANQQKLFQSLPEEEKSAISKRGAFLLKGVFAQLFNTFSLMTHGAKLTTFKHTVLNTADRIFYAALNLVFASVRRIARPCKVFAQGCE